MRTNFGWKLKDRYVSFYLWMKTLMADKTVRSSTTRAIPERFREEALIKRLYINGERLRFLLLQKLLYGSVLPMMADQLNQVDTMELVLPAFVALIERASVEQYHHHIRSHFNRVYRTARSVQVFHRVICCACVLATADKI